jgi:uncharacterized protein YhaN
MRLRRLDLDFFGHFAGKSYDFGAAKTGGSDFHIVFGANEAGKTTTMEGFLRLLYGFPLREPYAFRHPRANLRVSGLLEIGGAVQQFTRLPTRGSNLLNAQGDPVPETALQSALSGLTMEDYRKLLCLDDETIEKGGEEIAQSKGDIGRLLFSAAAGVSDLSVVLEEVDQQAGAFYKKGGSKSQFAQLKRALEDVSGEIKSRDVPAAEYRKLRQELDAAQSQEDTLRGSRLAALQRQSKLKALAAALPLAQRLAGVEAEVAALTAYPATLEIDPEELVQLLADRASLIASATAFEEEIAAKSEARAGLRREPALTEAFARLQALREPRGRYEAALIDLPKRRDAREAARADMRRCLRDIGLESEAPEALVLPEVELSALEQAVVGLGEAEGAARAAALEAREAKAKRAQAEQDLALARAQGEGSLPDLKALLARHDALRVFEAYTAAQQGLRLTRRAQEAALSQVTFGGQSFDAPPQAALSAAEATALARALDQAREKLATCGAAQSEAADRAAVLARQIGVIQSSGEIVTDAAAGESRAARDALWQAHLARLDAASAGAFETAMRVDDGHTAARQGHAKDLGALRQLELEAAQAEVKLEAARGAFSQAQADFETLEAEFAAAVDASGLARRPTPEAFAEWLRAVEAAREAASAYQRETREAAPAVAAAEGVRAALAQALNSAIEGAQELALAPLLDRAREEAERQGTAAQAIEAAQLMLTVVAREAEMRAGRAEAAVQVETEARAAWAGLIAARFGDQADPQRMRGALADLRRLREINATRLNLERQIHGMEADQAAFLEALADLAQDLGEIADLPPEARMRAIETQGAAARAAQDRWQALGDEVETAKAHLAEVATARAALEARVRHLAESFPPEIATQDISDLRDAVREGHRAITLRAEAEDLTRALCAGLSVQTRAEAEAALAGQDADAVQAALTEIERDLAPLDAALTQAIEARTRSQAALASVTGGDEVAALTARRRTLEAEMEAGAMRYLEDRLGHMLADRAIRRYRDTHRSGMMASAEAAFRALTSGAYGDLTTQSDGSAESLVAIQASDGAAKPAEAMSKGTRFQLYLALRAAAYAQMVENGTVLPFFCDDVFETFDDTRTRAACQLMHRIGQSGQAIYLTHHQHVVDIARETCGKEVVIHQL